MENKRPAVISWRYGDEGVVDDRTSLRGPLRNAMEERILNPAWPR
jgi:hypothetical protein